MKEVLENMKKIGVILNYETTQTSIWSSKYLLIL